MLADRKKAALFGLYIADAVAMPVHWMYDLRQLRMDYGKVTGYVKPKDKFSGSIMNLSNTGGGGRGAFTGSIIGDVINHGKKQYWVRGANFHYHLGLHAGENTLEAKICRLLTTTISSNKGTFDSDQFLKNYVQYMTTPDTHNDTYAATAHRMFFANYIQKLPLEACADNDGHNTDSIDGLTLCVPIILHSYNGQEEGPARDEIKSQARAVIKTLRKSGALFLYSDALTDLLCDVLGGKDLRLSLESCGSKYLHGSVKEMVESSNGADPMVACYIQSSFPAFLHFCYKYADDMEAAILANANAGGENVARGSLIGAVFGANVGGGEEMKGWMVEGLYHRAEIQEEIEKFIA